MGVAGNKAASIINSFMTRLHDNRTNKLLRRAAETAEPNLKDPSLLVVLLIREQFPAIPHQFDKKFQ
jgi:hypothetical protein